MTFRRSKVGGTKLIRDRLELKQIGGSQSADVSNKNKHPLGISKDLETSTLEVCIGLTYQASRFTNILIYYGAADHFKEVSV